MELLAFIGTVLFISISGVFMPGPVFATTINEGRNHPWAGIFISLGHAAVEIPIILALFFIGEFTLTDNIRVIIGFAGGFVLIYFAFLSLRRRESLPFKGVLAGVILSSLSPYFIMWWLTVGFTLVLTAGSFGILGLIVLILFHEGSDLTWYGFVGYASHSGMRFKHIEKLLLTISFIILVFFGCFFIYDGLNTLI